MFNLFKNKSILLLLLFFSILSPQYANSGEYYSWIRGANVPAIWYDSQSYSALDKIKNDGFNTVRLVWQTSGSSSRINDFLTKCDNLGLKAIVELHDATGGSTINSLDTCVNYWTQSSLLSILYNHPKA